MVCELYLNKAVKEKERRKGGRKERRRGKEKMMGKKEGMRKEGGRKIPIWD